MLYSLFFEVGRRQTCLSTSRLYPNLHSQTAFLHSTFSGSAATTHSEARLQDSPKATDIKFINFIALIIPKNNVSNLYFLDIFRFYTANDLHTYNFRLHIFPMVPVTVYTVRFRCILHCIELLWQRKNLKIYSRFVRFKKNTFFQTVFTFFRIHISVLAFADLVIVTLLNFNTIRIVHHTFRFR